jgi:polyisoprenoid-binding protein YceI
MNYFFGDTMKTTTASILLALPFLFASHAFAQHQTFTVDPQASTVAFTLNGSDHATEGTFHVQSGTVDFDRGTQKMSGTILVSAASGKTGNGSRDKKMTGEVLEASHFSDVTFAPQSYTGTLAATGDSTIQVTGVFTLHGAPHDLTTPMQVQIEGSACTAKTQFLVPYVKWGLKDPSIFLFKVAKEVNVDLTLKGTLSPASL